MAKKSSQRKNGLIFIAMAIVLIVAFFGALSLLRGSFQQETYYVLNQDIPTRTQISMDMLEPVQTSYGSAPGGTREMTQEEREAERAEVLTAVNSGTIYSSFPLVAGDILSPSNVGGLTDISVGVPDNWVVTNFSVGADDAVGGRIQRGYYFDMLVVNPDNNEAFYPFVNMLALDTTVDLAGASSAEAVETEEAQDGQTTQYVVGMSPENAARLHTIMNQYGGNVKLVLSPRQNEYEAPQLAAYEGIFSYIPGEEVVAPGLVDGVEVTDYTFTDVERDQFGVPIEQVENVGRGNAKISGEAADGAEPSESVQGTTPPTSSPSQGATDDSELPTSEETETPTDQ